MSQIEVDYLVHLRLWIDTNIDIFFKKLVINLTV